MNKVQKVFGISGWKNSGKTTLTSALISEFSSRGFTVSSIKHAHHEFDVDQEGTDSFKHRKSGAREVMLSSSKRFALMHEVAANAEPDLSQLLAKMAPVDLILVEGFKTSDIAKIQTIRAASLANSGKTSIANVAAFASDTKILEVDKNLPVLDINDVPAIADFISKYIGLTKVS